MFRDPAKIGVMVAIIGALAGLLFGYDTGTAAAAILFIHRDFHLTTLSESIVMSSILVGCIIGAAGGGAFVEKVGRRNGIILGAVIFAVGAVWTAVSPNTEILIAGRIVIGLAVGMASAIAPVYISEMAAFKNRGKLVSLFQLMTPVGQTAAFFIGLGFAGNGDWRMMFLVGVIPAILIGVGMYFMPQSPRWLASVGRNAEAKETLELIRSDSGEDWNAEYDEIVESVKTSKAGTYKDLLAPFARRALTIGLLLAIFQQITGINTVLYFAPTILQKAGMGSASAALLASSLVGVVFVIFAVVAIFIIDRMGRRPMLIAGVAGMGVSMAIVGLAFTPAFAHIQVATAIGGFMAYVAFFAISLGPVFWTMNSELYPLRIRGRASGIGAMTNWLFNLIVTVSFLTMLNALGSADTFWLYAIMCGVCLIFAIFFVPETKDRTLEEIESYFKTGVHGFAGRTRIPKLVPARTTGKKTPVSV